MNAKLTMVAVSAMNVKMDFITIQIVTVSQRNILLRAHCYTEPLHSGSNYYIRGLIKGEPLKFKNR